MVKNMNLFEDLERKRERICLSAVEIFSEKSFDKTTVSEIARNAGVGKGTFYLYFNSKEELLSFLLEHGIERLIYYVSEKIEDGTGPIEKLELAIDAQLYFFSKYHEYFSFFIRELWSYREGLRDQIIRLKENYIVIFENIIREGKEKGHFKDINIETMASGIFGFLSVSSVHWTLFAQDFSVENIDSSIKEVIFNGLKL